MQSCKGKWPEKEASIPVRRNIRGWPDIFEKTKVSFVPSFAFTVNLSGRVTQYVVTY